MYKVGDYVQWVASVRGKTYNRAGEVISAVPPGKNPLKYVPPTYDLHIRGKPRDVLSFLIRIPGCRTLYWPNPESLYPLPMSDYALLYNQQLYMKVRSIHDIDQSDRQSIKAICKLMDLVYDDQYFENEKSITVPAWGRRFHFKVNKGIEYLYEIEDFKPVWVRSHDEKN